MTDEALALATLLRGSLRRAASTASAWDLALAAGWVATTHRTGEVVLREAWRADVEARLTALCPTWRDDVSALEEAGLPLSPAGWRALRDHRRQGKLPTTLPRRLNQRTAAAALRSHSKALLGEGARAALEGVQVTHDNFVRLRPHAGLRVAAPSGDVDAALLVAMCGDVCVTERAFLDGTRLAGPAPEALVLVENVGAFVDLPLPSGWCAAHVPGWNTSMVAPLRDAWPETPAVLFGDLDPNGVSIARTLQASWPGLRWFVPELARDYLDGAQSGEWPALGEVPPVIAELSRRSRWIEQEVLLLDSRLVRELAASLGVPA